MWWLAILPCENHSQEQCPRNRWTRHSKAMSNTFLQPTAMEILQKGSYARMCCHQASRICIQIQLIARTYLPYLSQIWPPLSASLGKTFILAMRGARLLDPWRRKTLRPVIHPPREFPTPSTHTHTYTYSRTHISEPPAHKQKRQERTLWSAYISSL